MPHRPLPGKGKSECHHPLVGQIAWVVIVALAIAFTHGLESAVSGLKSFWNVAPMMGIAARGGGHA